MVSVVMNMVMIMVLVVSIKVLIIMMVVIIVKGQRLVCHCLNLRPLHRKSGQRHFVPLPKCMMHHFLDYFVKSVAGHKCIVLCKHTLVPDNKRGITTQH